MTTTSLFGVMGLVAFVVAVVFGIMNGSLFDAILAGGFMLLFQWQSLRVPNILTNQGEVEDFPRTYSLSLVGAILVLVLVLYVVFNFGIFGRVLLTALTVIGFVVFGRGKKAPKGWA